MRVLENNDKAINLYEKIGMKKEGILRKSSFKNNQYRNELIYGILKEEFNESV